MFSQIQFNSADSANIYKPATYSFVSTTILLVVLHYTNEIKNIGYLQSFYIPLVLVCLDLVKQVCKGNASIPSNKQTKSPRLNLYLLFKAVLFIFISTATYFILAILFGAKAFSEHEETLMLAIYLTVCTTIHCLINMGSKDFNSMLTKPNNSNEIVLDSSQIVALCSIFGCWSSAVVIPLDWDRWWQKWPIPSTMGTIIGYNIGFVVTIIVNYFWTTNKHRTSVSSQKRKHKV